MSDQHPDGDRPEAQEPPRPRYGEYAPPGWTPPQQPAGPAAQEGSVGQGEAAPPQQNPGQGYGAPQQQYPPQYQQGQYPQQPQYSPQQSTQQQYPGAPQQPGWNSGTYDPANWGDPARDGRRPRKLWDAVLTIILLVVGFFGAGIGLLIGAGLTDPEAISESLRQQYGGDPQIVPGPWPAVIMIANVVLYLAAVALSVLRLVRRRIAFWIPIVAWAVALIVFIVAVMAIALSDPGYIETINRG